MNSKTKVYRKIFIKEAIYTEIAIFGGLIYYLLTYYDGDSLTLLILTTFSSLNFGVFSFLYFYDPKQDNLISKEKFDKIIFRDGLILLLSPVVIIFAYLFPIPLKGTIPMPISGFYAIIISSIFLSWIFLNREDLKQIINVFTIFLKNDLYSGTWPAEWRLRNTKKGL